MESNIQDVIKQIAYEVHNHGGKMYYVGGYVRDLQLDKEPSDIDVRVIGISKNAFNSILERFGRTYWIKARYDIVKLLGYDIDFASPINKDGTLKTIDNLTENIDFTMNSILVDVVTEEVIDPFNGIEDIKNRVVRIAKINDIDDEFMAVRACRFKAKLGFEIEDNSAEKIKGFSFENINKQRILPELRKVMNMNPDLQIVFFQTALELSVLDKVFNPLGKLSGLDISVEEIQIDAFEHTMRMLRYFGEFKERMSNYEEMYMTLLTYHFRIIPDIEFIDEFREFFQNIVATNKIKNTANYFSEHANVLFRIYNNFQNMSIKELAVAYGKYRRILEDSGFLIESYNMGLIENPSQEQIAESKKRLDMWQERIKEARILNVKDVKKPHIKEKKQFTKGVPKPYNFEDIKEVTQGISPKQVVSHLNTLADKNRRRKHGRNR